MECGYQLDLALCHMALLLFEFDLRCFLGIAALGRVTLACSIDWSWAEPGGI